MMTFPFSNGERRLTHFAMKGYKPTREVTGYDKAGQPIIQTHAEAADSRQATTHQQALASKPGQLVKVEGGLTEAQYARSDTERVQIPGVNGKPGTTLYAPKGQEVKVTQTQGPAGGSGASFTPSYLPQPTQQQPTSQSKPVTFAKPLTGDQIKSKAAQRRDERIRLLGISPTSEIISLLDQGYRFGGTDNGTPYLKLGDTIVPINGLNESTVLNASKEADAGNLDIAGIEESVANENNAILEDEKKTMLGKQGETPTTQEDGGTGMDAALDSALAALGPEGQALRSVFGKVIGDIGKLTQQNQAFAKDQAELIGSRYDQIQSELDTMKSDRKFFTSELKKVLDEDKKDTDEQLAKEQAAAEQKLQWDADKETVRLEKEKGKQHEAMVVQIALMGGFAQDAALNAVRESDAEYDKAISNVQTELGHARTDLSVKYSGLNVANKKDYRQKSLENMKELVSGLERIGLQYVSSTQARSTAEQNLLQSAWNTEIDLRKTSASTNMTLVKEMQGVINQSRDDKRAQEQDAMDRIEWLVGNYDPRQVEGAIRELAKDVPGLNVDSLVNNPTIELMRMKKTGSGSGGTNGGFGSFIPMPEKKDMISYEEFTQKKIAEMENNMSQTLSSEKRTALMTQNKELWQKEYRAMVSPSVDSLPSSGDVNVDNAAQQVLDGVFGGVDPIERAAETWGVPRAAVANQMKAYRSSGYVPDFPQFTDTQVERYEPFIKRIRATDAYQSAANAAFIKRRIDVALSLGTGQGDSTAVELLQRGIKDPGMAVRQDDIERIASAVPWIDSLNPETWLGKIKEGKLFGPAGRAQLQEVIDRISEESISAYNEETLPGIRLEAKRLGLPESAFRDIDDIIDYGGTNIQDVTSTYGYGPTE